MKLSELKAGMLVECPKYVQGRQATVIGVGKRGVFLEWCHDGFEQLVIGVDDGWIIVEPRKKPSERLVEILNEVSPRFDPAPTDILRVISRYLDEQASEQK